MTDDEDGYGPLPYSSPEDAEFPYTAGDAADAWNKEKLVVWKQRSQRNKDWRFCRCVKAVKKQPEEGVLGGIRQSCSRFGVHFAETAVSVVRQDACMESRLRIRSGKLSDDAGSRSKIELEVSHPIPCHSTHSYQISSNQPESVSSNLLPYENFVGAFLGSSFRLLGFRRSENHGEVYAAEDLNPPTANGQSRYEAKAYVLRGIEPKLHGYRIRNLRKLKAEKSFVTSIEQHGRVFIVNMVEGEWRQGLDSQSSSTTPKHRLELRAIGQRQSPEFEAAFPGLPRLCQSRAAESSQTSQRKPTALLHKDYASALRHEVNDTIKPRPAGITTIRATTAETMPCQPDRNEAGEGIPKLGQQEERNRIRRAKARAKKRSQKEEKRKMERKMERKMAERRREVWENWGRKEQEWSERKNMRGLREWGEWDWCERESLTMATKRAPTTLQETIAQAEDTLMESSLINETILMHLYFKIKSKILPKTNTIFEDNSLAIQLKEILLMSLHTKDFSKRRAYATVFTTQLLWGTTTILPGENCWLCPTVPTEHIHNSVELCLSFINAISLCQQTNQTRATDNEVWLLFTLTKRLVTFTFLNWAKHASTVLINNSNELAEHPKCIHGTSVAQRRLPNLISWLNRQPEQERLLCEVLLDTEIWAGNETIDRATLNSLECPPPIKPAPERAQMHDEIYSVLSAVIFRFLLRKRYSMNKRRILG